MCAGCALESAMAACRVSIPSHACDDECCDDLLCRNRGRDTRLLSSPTPIQVSRMDRDVRLIGEHTKQAAFQISAE
jgi:hypothetical protein